jgi:hypothetical protein
MSRGSAAFSCSSYSSRMQQCNFQNGMAKRKLEAKTMCTTSLTSPLVLHFLHVCNVQYWPKVTHAMKRASHVECNACNARIQRVLHRICYTRMSRIWSAFCIALLHECRASSVHFCVTFAHHNCIWHALHDVFVARVSSIHIL